MKATGIVRRIDELGRVVIPKEIRRTLRLSSGDPLEIYTDKDELLFKKYSPIRSIDGFAGEFASALSEISGYVAAVCDTDTVVAVSGGAKELIGKRISAETERIMRERRAFLANSADGERPAGIAAENPVSCTSQVIAPVVSSGDCLGACVLFSTENGARMRESDLKLAMMSADLMARRFSE